MKEDLLKELAELRKQKTSLELQLADSKVKQAFNGKQMAAFNGKQPAAGSSEAGQLDNIEADDPMFKTFTGTPGGPNDGGVSQLSIPKDSPSLFDSIGNSVRRMTTSISPSLGERLESASDRQDKSSQTKVVQQKNHGAFSARPGVDLDKLTSVVEPQQSELDKAVDRVLDKSDIREVKRLLDMGTLSSKFMDMVEDELAELRGAPVERGAIRPKRQDLMAVVAGVIASKLSAQVNRGKKVALPTGPASTSGKWRNSVVSASPDAPSSSKDGASLTA